jgi:ubiquinone/menaquinone biosynthesis C-methylase UbiE
LATSRRQHRPAWTFTAPKQVEEHATSIPLIDDDSFDMAGSQFGVMLFPDMPMGVSEMVRVAKPGGRVLMIVYGDPHKIVFFSTNAGRLKVRF